MSELTLLTGGARKEAGTLVAIEENATATQVTRLCHRARGAKTYQMAPGAAAPRL